jgi:hypothetical protein
MGKDQIQYVSALTAWLLYLMIISIGTYDIVVSWRYGNDATVSRVVWRFSAEYPILAFAAGLVIGHLLWPQRFLPE